MSDCSSFNFMPSRPHRRGTSAATRFARVQSRWQIVAFQFSASACWRADYSLPRSGWQCAASVVWSMMSAVSAGSHCGCSSCCLICMVAWPYSCFARQWRAACCSVANRGHNTPRCDLGLAYCMCIGAALRSVV